MIYNYLIIYIQRINKILKTKNTSNIEFLEILYMDEFCEDELKAKSIKLRLLGINIHTYLIEFGHYYTIFKFYDKWFRFNDDRIFW